MDRQTDRETMDRYFHFEASSAQTEAEEVVQAEEEEMWSTREASPVLKVTSKMRITALTCTLW